MSTPTDPRKERPGTYVMSDRAGEEELTRLYVQGQIMTAGMKGVLPDVPDPANFQAVLDVACGVGDWLIELACTYPTLSRLVGVDISLHRIGYARQRAEEQQVGDRVQFLVMDALRAFEFPSDAFDLVNMRGALSFLRSWEWPQLLQECQRVSRSEGVVRIVDMEFLETNAPTLNSLVDLFLRGYSQAGHTLTTNSDFTAVGISSLLSSCGLQHVQEQRYTLEYRAGTAEGHSFYEDMRRLLRNGLPILRKWARIPDNFEELYQQALTEIQQPDFVAEWHAVAAWGRTPLKKPRSSFSH